ncbi:HIT domain-containing protein [Candidatus Saccharibacteria bacterium]|nr:HIT domain-containing protein [Candidatus Saccharibacteria bacterium]
MTKDTLYPKNIFTLIIRGEAPAYRIYEDAHTLAILDTKPSSPGHVLVLSKSEVDKFYELPPDEFTAVMHTVKKLAVAMERALEARIIMRASGNTLPHVHIHLTPRDKNWYYERVVEMSEAEMEAVALKIKMNL